MCTDGAVEPKPATPDYLEARLRKAVALQAVLTADRVVAEMVGGRSSETMGIIGGIGSAAGRDGLAAHAAEALAWLRWLEPNDAALVRARVAGAPWKSICWRFGISRPTADRRYRYGFALIAWHLNDDRSCNETPSLRSLLGMQRKATCGGGS